jgi:thymidylate synthase ThyX
MEKKVAYDAHVLADSLSPAGVRLTTLEVTFPRIVLAEFNTHRVFSRNSASSRAIPFNKRVQALQDDPFIPVYWGANQPGMQADSELSVEDRREAINYWLAARDEAITWAERMAALGVHKQIVNRLLEPFLWHTVIVTATEWANFFALRISHEAQPEIRVAAELMRDAMDKSTPTELGAYEWHLPLIQPDEMEWAKENPDQALKVSTGRCARVSYLTHGGVRDINEDIKMHDRLLQNGHMSPFEHQARPLEAVGAFSGNFRGWQQYRKTIPGESNYAAKQLQVDATMVV